MVKSGIPSGSMQQRYEQKHRPHTRLKLLIDNDSETPFLDECNRDTSSTPVLQVARNGCSWRPVWTNATEIRAQNVRSRSFLLLSAEL